MKKNLGQSILEPTVWEWVSVLLNWAEWSPGSIKQELERTGPGDAQQLGRSNPNNLTIKFGRSMDNYYSI